MIRMDWFPTPLRHPIQLRAVSCLTARFSGHFPKISLSADLIECRLSLGPLRSRRVRRQNCDYCPRRLINDETKPQDHY